MENVKTIQLRCQDCNGTMNIDKDKQVLLCPYCGSKKILIESDAVKIEQMRTQAELGRQQTYRDVELAKRQVEIRQQQLELSKQEYEENKKKRESRDNMFYTILLLMVVIILGIFAVLHGPL